MYSWLFKNVYAIATTNNINHIIMMIKLIAIARTVRNTNNYDKKAIIVYSTMHCQNCVMLTLKTLINKELF